MESEFEKTYRNYYPKLFRIAAKLLQDSEGAKDVVQDVFTSYFHVVQDKKTINNLEKWLVRSTINKGVDYKRKNARLVVLEDMQTNENIVENQNDASEILNVVERLDKKEKTMVVLYSEGYSYKEIAEITGRNFNSVGKTLSRIMEKIKKQLHLKKLPL